jgi:hypothetical protein
MHKENWNDRWMWVAALLVACCGCSKGSNLAEVRGRVTYDGQPVSQMKVELDPVGKGRQSVGYTDERGEYEIQYTMNQSGALIGRHTVVLQHYPEPSQKSVSVPEKYSKSEVEFEVHGGSNRLDIELKNP